MADADGSDLERVLRDLPRIGTLVKDRPYRQIWRFEVSGRGYYLKFFPRASARLKRAVRGSPAVREFARLQWLQKADVPAPRAVALLNGFSIGEVKGDAVISQAIEPGVTLDRYFNELELRGERSPEHLDIARRVRELVFKLREAGYGHDDLHLGNFLRAADGAVYLLDAYAVTAGGLTMRQVYRLGHSVARYATRQDLRRGWAMLSGEREMPRVNPISSGIWKKFLGRIAGPNGDRHFGTFEPPRREGANEDGRWRGVCFKSWKYPARFAPASRLEVAEKDWEREWPVLLDKLQGDLLEVLKTSASGDVLAGEVTLAGRVVEVVVKRPRAKTRWRAVNQVFRGSRAWRAWRKAWNLLVRGIPTAWPLVVMERRVMGYVVDQAIVFERVPGKTLAWTNIDLMPAAEREDLFRCCGRILRRIEDAGFCHFDSKSSNWIVAPDERRGPTPVLVDVDGVRFYPWDGFGIQRLLRSMKEHRQYDRQDSLALCLGYAPFTRMTEEEEGQ